MLVTFHTKAYADITMFGDVAKSLLTLMGHSGTIPSAILAADVPAALAKLKHALALPQAAAGEAASAEAEEVPVSLAQRAFPLVKLLEAAANANADVMWD